ncbi:MAG: sulfurtransferase-like selenium metabolism protein YedF [Synergistaceae bacterium]|nr:sulfurtransferase-like selenium metabolism protein YedF [Synergistaceae bacterium]
MAEIDARGRNCPQPVMMTKTLIDSGEREIEILLDNAVSASNVRRFLEKSGYAVSIIDEEGTITLQGSRSGKERTTAPVHPQPERDLEDAVLLLTGATIGEDDADLGEILMKGFLGTLSRMNCPPSTLSLMNEGVKLALKNTSTCDHLTALSKKGVTILVCGTCTNHFGITQEIGIGVISNLSEIAEVLLSSAKTITL